MNTKMNTSTSPQLYSELILCFDYDFPLRTIDDIIGLSATKYQFKSNAIINPITKMPNPAFWEYRTEIFEDFDCANLVTYLIDLLDAHQTGFLEAINRYKPIDVILRVHILIHKQGEYPAVYIPPRLSSLCSSMNAEIDIVIDNIY